MSVTEHEVANNEDVHDETAKNTHPRTSMVLDQPQLDAANGDDKVVVKLGPINPKYPTNLGRLTADANERAFAVKDVDVLHSEVTAEELAAVEMLKEWERSKTQRIQRTDKVMTKLQHAIAECERDDDIRDQIYHHQIKENKWTEMTLHELETKYFKKKIHLKKTCIQIDARSLTDGALLSLCVSHRSEQPSAHNAMWQTLEPSNYCRIIVNDMDAQFVTDKYYYVSIRAISSTVGGTIKFKIRINAISQSKKCKECTIGLGVKQKLLHRLRQISNNKTEMDAFKQRIEAIREKHKANDTVTPNEKIKINTECAGDLIFGAPKSPLFSELSTKWSKREDRVLLKLVDRYKHSGADKWDQIAIAMQNEYNMQHIKTARECNDRAANLKRAGYMAREEKLMIAAMSKKQEIEEDKIRQCELKLEQLKFKEMQRLERREHAARQRQLQPLQKKWLILLAVVARVQHWNECLIQHRQTQRELRLQVAVCVTIQRFMRKKFKREREWKAYLISNTLRSQLRLFVINREINKYNRSANIIGHFLETQTNNTFNPISIIISNFRNSVITIQRFARKVGQKRRARVLILQCQFEEHITSMIKSCKGNTSKERRYRFSEPAISKTVQEFYQQKSNEHRRRTRIWYEERKKYCDKKAVGSAVELFLAQQKKSKKIASFYTKKPLFGLRIDEDDLDALILKAEKFQKQQRHA